ncbi:unnamed protein product [Brachionus calyciflorus]|uniref:SCP domain-containing protein n=1 Tax=Brachionus calyciflorus TaxID=104777 RepID=A0A814GCM6_9BILA|nr:unnamed protein product [Brachionus calyciflorus]
MKFCLSLILIVCIGYGNLAEIQQRCQSNFNKCIIKTHNKLRALHQSPPLVEDSNLKTIALEYSQKMARENKLIDNPRLNELSLGENLGLSYNFKGFDMNKCGQLGKSYAEKWYSEIENWDFIKSKGKNTRHFTQVVWKDTKKIGCGLAIGSNGKKAYITCNYDPPMNGDYSLNVKQNSILLNRNDEEDPDCDFNGSEEF